MASRVPLRLASSEKRPRIAVVLLTWLNGKRVRGVDFSKTVEVGGLSRADVLCLGSVCLCY